MANDDFSDDFSGSTSGKGKGKTEAEPDLTAFDDGFGIAEASDDDEPPDGKYAVEVEKFEITHTRGSEKEPPKPMLKWTTRIFGPSSAGRMLWINRVVTEKTLAFIKRDLQKLGMPIGKLSELSPRKAEMIGKRIEVDKKTTVSKKTNKPFTDIKIMKLLGEGGMEAEGLADDFGF